MWDLIVFIPDHCLSIYIVWFSFSVHSDLLLFSIERQSKETSND